MMSTARVVAWSGRDYCFNSSHHSSYWFLDNYFNNGNSVSVPTRDMTTDLRAYAVLLASSGGVLKRSCPELNVPGNGFSSGRPWIRLGLRDVSSQDALPAFKRKNN